MTEQLKQESGCEMVFPCPSMSNYAGASQIGIVRELHRALESERRLYMPLILKSIKILLKQVKCSECPK